MSTYRCICLHAKQPGAKPRGEVAKPNRGRSERQAYICSFWHWTVFGCHFGPVLDFSPHIYSNVCTYTYIYLHMKTYTHIYLYTATYTYICLHIAAYAYMLSSGGRSPEARWRSQTEVVLMDRLIQVASGIFTYQTYNVYQISCKTPADTYLHIRTYPYIYLHVHRYTALTAHC